MKIKKIGKEVLKKGFVQNFSLVDKNELSRGDKISYKAYIKNFNLQKSVGYIDKSTKPMTLEEYSYGRSKGKFSTALQAIDKNRNISEKRTKQLVSKIKEKMKELGITSVDYSGSYYVAKDKQEEFSGTFDIKNAYSLYHKVSRLKAYEAVAIMYQLFGDYEESDKIYGYITEW